MTWQLPKMVSVAWDFFFGGDVDFKKLTSLSRMLLPHLQQLGQIENELSNNLLHQLYIQNRQNHAKPLHPGVFLICLRMKMVK